jgi:hypothetical protein
VPPAPVEFFVGLGRFAGEGIAPCDGRVVYLEHGDINGRWGRRKMKAEYAMVNFAFVINLIKESLRSRNLTPPNHD